MIHFPRFPSESLEPGLVRLKREKLLHELHDRYTQLILQLHSDVIVSGDKSLQDVVGNFITNKILDR